MKNTYLLITSVPNSPAHSGCSWSKCGKILDTGRTTSDVLNFAVTEMNLSKISHQLENSWPIKVFKLEFQYSNSFSNASMKNGWRSSNWSRVAAQFPLVSLFCAEITWPIFTKILHDIVSLLTLLNHVYTGVNLSHFRTREQRVKVAAFDVC